MNTECLECQPFIDETERLFGSTLQKYGFSFIECYGEREGRECQVMYDGTIGRVLFVLQDGETFCCLGTHDTPFPPFALIYGIGDYGWYQVITLAEVASGQSLLSKQDEKAIRRGHLYYYEWQAKLLEERAEQLFTLLEPDRRAETAKRVERHVQQRLKRYQ